MAIKVSVARKVQEAPTVYPKWYCSCGQLVGGYKVKCFMGVEKAKYCPNCGNSITYEKEK